MTLTDSAICAVAACLEHPKHNVKAFVGEGKRRAFLDTCGRICAICGIPFDIGADYVLVKWSKIPHGIIRAEEPSTMGIRGFCGTLILDEFTFLEDHTLDLKKEIEQIFEPVLAYPRAKLIQVNEREA